MIILLVIAIAAVTAPVVGVLLVSHASRREDAALSLSRQPSGVLQAATRRLLNFHGDGIGRPAGLGGTGARPGDRPDGGWLGGDGTFPADGEFLDKGRLDKGYLDDGADARWLAGSR
ncbi:MAG TPA: hypothetical protein VK599_15330 [Streptosporangiaceae bacterium]|jgi:hypothetical protein|nr:hypothetical protein [Streptosporangiaceae bacterium]